ncbi:Amidohydrolase 3 [uncultured Woeseiaceae bacterium]|uniref:Amidohydrolase 3 n=1 Tax=uncultured Woeseiaceae bacterium TaxID=1983305 RepID=A0A7D9D2E9_9GAMM|nr:Amidohydrolase 3 [uncultured Woeseiaceae bacterium]
MNPINRINPALRVCACVLALLASACSEQPDAVDEAPGPDLIVINADVRTVDSTMPIAEAFAITMGKFIAVGSTGEIQDLARENTDVIDAGGVTITPGLIDGHTHLLMGSGLAVGVDLSEIEDKSEWLRIIGDKAQSLPEGAWILGGAWDHNLSDGVLPTKEMLDSVAPDHPVLLRDIDGHSAWANSLAIELAGVTADSTVPPGGEIVVDPNTGDLTGIFLESAGGLFGDSPGMAEATDPVVGIKAAVELANSLGITAVHDMSNNFDEFLSVFDDGDLTLRVWQGARPPRVTDRSPSDIYAEMAAERERVRMHVAGNPQTASMGILFDIGYTKLMVDGVLSTYTALMKAPYSDNPDAVAEAFVTQEQLNSLIAAAHDNGFPVAVHAIGDEGVSWVLDGFAESPTPAGVLGDRIEHIEVVTPDDVERFESLGITASMQPHHATCCVGNYVIDHIGRDRLPNAYVWRSMLDSDIPLVLGSDWPTSPLNPLIQMADTIHRETRIDGVVRPWDEGNALTFEEALYGYTQAGANMTSWSDEIGSITVGKWADFVILDEKLPADVDRALENRQVAATYLAGKRVYPQP